MTNQKLLLSVVFHAGVLGGYTVAVNGNDITLPDENATLNFGRHAGRILVTGHSAAGAFEAHYGVASDIDEATDEILAWLFN
jgi:hypothetical protein